MTEIKQKYIMKSYAHAGEVTAQAYIKWLADLFRYAPRIGGETDNPEGSRTVLFSHTMAEQIADDLQQLAGGEGALTYEG